MKKLDRVILIDDDYYTNLYNETMLYKNNITNEVITFNNGLNAKEYLRITPERINLILLDLDMPIMNGYKFIEKIENELPENENNPQIVVLTSYKVDNELLTSIKSNRVKKFFQKPLTDELLNEIMELF